MGGALARARVPVGVCPGHHAGVLGRQMSAHIKISFLYLPLRPGICRFPPEVVNVTQCFPADTLSPTWRPLRCRPSGVAVPSQWGTCCLGCGLEVGSSSALAAAVLGGPLKCPPRVPSQRPRPQVPPSEGACDAAPDPIAVPVRHLGSGALGGHSSAVPGWPRSRVPQWGPSTLTVGHLLS